MALQKAQSAFQSAFDDLKGNGQKEEFLQWIFETRGHSVFANGIAAKLQAMELKLSEIIADLKEVVPFNGVFDSEKLHFPTDGEHADCNPKHTVHIDAFLYDDWMLDQMCEEGKLSRSYCKDCESHNTAPIMFVSHSMSKRRLQYMFLSMLPDLRGKTIVDVGSRLGTVLFGAYVYSSASKIIGVEMNSDLCDLQRRVTNKFHMEDKIQVICDDIRNRADILKAADVVVIHSVVDFFLPENEHAAFWKFISENTRTRGKLMVVTPSLEKTIKRLDMPIDVASWVKPITNPQLGPQTPTEMEGAQVDPDLAELNLYECK